MRFILEKKYLNFTLLSIYKHRDLKGYQIRWSGIPSKNIKTISRNSNQSKNQKFKRKKVTREVNRKNVLEENGQAKILHKNDTAFTSLESN